MAGFRRDEMRCDPRAMQLDEELLECPSSFAYHATDASHSSLRIEARAVECALAHCQSDGATGRPSGRATPADSERREPAGRRAAMMAILSGASRGVQAVSSTTSTGSAVTVTGTAQATRLPPASPLRLPLPSPSLPGRALRLA